MSRSARAWRAAAIGAVMALVGCGGEGKLPVAPATHPAIGLDRSTVDWSTPWGVVPAEQTVAITNTGDGTLSGLTVGPPRYSAGQPSDWLSVQSSGTTAPASLTLRPASASLAPGSYTATIPISTSAVGATGKQRDIAVTLTINPPTLVVDSTQLRTSVCLCNGSLGWIGSGRSVKLYEKTGMPLSGLRVLGITDATGAALAWLSATLSDTVAPATLAIWVPSTGVTLPPIGATSTAFVEVGSSVGGVIGSPTRIAVSLTVNGPQRGTRVEGVNFAGARAGVPLPKFDVYYCEYYKGFCFNSYPFVGAIRLVLYEIGGGDYVDVSDRLVGQASAVYSPATQGARFDSVIVSKPGSYSLIVLGAETPHFPLTVAP